MVHMTAHSFISKCQVQYLKLRKTNCLMSTVIILIHYAENYSFVVQDEVQGSLDTRNSTHYT